MNWSEPRAGIEPATSSLPRTRSTTEPPGRDILGVVNFIRKKNIIKLMPSLWRTTNNQRSTNSYIKKVVSCHLRRGFTLIEIVLSTFLILIFVSIVLSASGTYLTTRRSNLVYIASKIASRQFESLRSYSFLELPTNGSINDLDLSKLPSGVATRQVSNYQASSKIKQVIIDITWTENNAGRELKMVSLFTENGM